MIQHSNSDDNSASEYDRDEIDDIKWDIVCKLWKPSFIESINNGTSEIDVLKHNCGMMMVTYFMLWT